MTKGEWKPRKLGDFFRIKHGYPFKSKFFSTAGDLIVLTPGNFHAAGGIKLKGDKEKFYTGTFPPEYLLTRGDMLVVMTDLTQNAPILGSPAFVPESDRYLHNQRLGKVVDVSTEIDRRFLFYLFNSFAVRDRLKATATGATVKHTAPERIYSVDVQVPGLSTQRKVASILSAYDDLIENNLRRIQILEEMAQAMYREWFLELRFSGHEEVEIAEFPQGLTPNGWRRTVLGELVHQERRSVKPSELDSETPYIGLEHLPRRSITLAEWGRVGEVGSTKLRFKRGDILFGKIRPYFHKVGVAPLDGVCSSDAIVVVVDKPEHFSIALCCISSDAFVAHATQTSQGTKMPRANWDVLVKYPVLLPPSHLFDQFNGFIEAVVAQLQNFIWRNKALRKSRDLLLPKLIAGELDVSDLDVDVGETA